MIRSEIKQLLLEEIKRDPDRAGIDILSSVVYHSKLDGVQVVTEWGEMLLDKRIRQLWVNAGSLARPRWIQRWITT